LIPLALSSLGIVGALGIALVPMRAWVLFVRRRIWYPIAPALVQVVLAAVPASAIAWAGWLGSESLPKVHRCLMDTLNCSANRSGGMIALATFGLGVLAVEPAWLAAGLAQHCTGARPNKSLERTRER